MDDGTLFGYAGRILFADLSRGVTRVVQPSSAFYRKYMGGSALGAYFALLRTRPGVNAFSPENVLVFALGPMTGTPISGQSRVTVTAKSPLTGAIGDSQGGGFFPAQMKFAGFDAVVIEGRSQEPVYLWLHDGEGELRNADHLWGKVTGEVEDMVRQELGDKGVEVAQCGPAGEKLARYAGIMTMCNRANGRTGMGAVMGSKNLKAVAVRGTRMPNVYDSAQLHRLSAWGASHFDESGVVTLGRLGTAGIVGSQNAAGGLPTRNWQSGVCRGWENLDGIALERSILKDRDTCFACVVRCKRVVSIEGGQYPVGPRYGGPEYETLAALGTYCGIVDLAAVSFANQLCNMYGLDTISCGATIAWAMDCYENGILSEKDTGGLRLRFGDAEAMVAAVEMIGKREGIGDLLAEGSARAAVAIGRGAERLVVAVKNSELPAHMPQVKRSLALIYAVNPFGADHMSHEHDPSYSAPSERMKSLGLDSPQHERVLNEEKVRFAATTQYLYSCLDTLSLCQFVYGPSWQLYSPQQMVEAVGSVTGWDIDLDELLRVGARRLNMLRMFNAREGFDRSDDRLPGKMERALEDGESSGLFVPGGELEQAKRWYYGILGWDRESGNPKEETLERLGLAWVLTHPVRTREIPLDL